MKIQRIQSAVIPLPLYIDRCIIQAAEYQDFLRENILIVTIHAGHIQVQHNEKHFTFPKRKQSPFLKG
jgi:hypothetical protein